ncbi:MAG: hypothetical protein SFV24_19005 [Gemmatimonadales bacterium]|nr:hypothetical protein [Gemmatimonadales bacterium]
MNDSTPYPANNPLIGGFPEVFDSSMLAAFKSCPQLFKKIYIDQWKGRDNVHLHAGGAFAKGIEVARVEFYVNGKSADEAVALGLGALLEKYGDFECPADSPKSAERMAGALEFYFDRYPLNHTDAPPISLPGGKRGIEFNFVQPTDFPHPVTGNPVLYCGRLDAILQYAGGVFVTDEKTTTSLGASWSRQWDLRSQFTGYAWGCRSSGIRVDGALIRGVSILKTKYDTQEAITYRPEWMVDRWYNELMEWLTDIRICWETGRWRYNLDHSCADYGGCAYRSACMSQDESAWLSTQFVRKHWDPVTRTETLLG